MLRDSRSPCSRFLPTRAALHWAWVFVSASILLAGCASLPDSSSLLKTRGNDAGEYSTVRSQDAALSIDPVSSEPSQSAAADYGKLQSRFGTGQPDPAGRLEKSIAAPGHSFLQPKARLGRPIPVPENSMIVPETQPAPGNQKARPIGVEIDETVPNDSRGIFGRTPWPSDNGPAGQSINESVPSWAQLDHSFSEVDNNKATPQSGSFPASVPAPETLKQTAEFSIHVGATEPIAEIPGSSGEDSGSTVSDPSTGPKAELAPAPEPTMLDRFRGLYAPRMEDNTDKFRKQIRRWPDPFGLLKDHDDNADSIPGASLSQPTENQSPSVPAVPMADAFPPVNEIAVSPLDTAIADLEKTLEDWPGTPSGKPERPAEWRQRQTDLRLLYLVAGRSAESIRVIESLPGEEQEFWQSLMLAMNRYRESHSDNSRAEQLSQVLEHLREASRKLQPLSTLQMRHMVFCDRIDGFGNVSAFPTADFNPGQRVLVYADVQNFRSELTPEGTYRSEFAAVIEFMRQGDDEIVETIRLPQILDLCNVERSDYFQSFELTLPALAGTYNVRIRLRDQLSLQTAESQLEFHIRSQNSGL